ncbi:MAG: GtrA family protein [Bacteroidota bacterium]
MSELVQKLKKLFFIQLRFALTSSMATLVDLGLWTLLTYLKLLAPETANIVSGFCGMVVNFFLQKRYVFDLQRKVSTAFIMALVVSLGGIALGTFIISLLVQIPFFTGDFQILAKLCATGIVFFYNFFLKRYVFEKRFFEVD